jgi:outer membrane lipoprotein-sorting protein
MGVQGAFKPRPVAVQPKHSEKIDVFARPLALTLFAAPALIAAAPVAGELAQVQQHLAGVSSMTANFSQTDRNGRVLTGTMTLKRPGKIRFQYQKGVPQLIVADGRSLYFIDYQVRQVDRWPIGNSPLAVLLNPKRDITKFAKLNPTSDPRVVSIEVHDSAHPEYGRITMIFQKNAAGPAGLILQGWVALDSQNNRTTIRLTNQQINGNVSDGVFRWNDPRSQGPRNR